MKKLLTALTMTFLAMVFQMEFAQAEIRYGMLHYNENGHIEPGPMPEFDRNAPQDHSLIKAGTYKVPWSKTGILKLTHKKGNLYNISMKASEPKLDTSFENDCWQYQNLLFCPMFVQDLLTGQEVDSFVVAIQESPTKLKIDGPYNVISFYCGNGSCFNLDYEKVK